MINTQGFGVRAMPVYTPVDPSLAAFNPGALASGVGTSFQLANLLEQVRAQRQKRQMMDAIMQGQIEAENARNRQTVAISEPQTRALLSSFDTSIAKDDMTKSLIPSEVALGVKRNEQTLRTLEPVANATIANANLGEKRAVSDTNLVDLEGATKAAQMGATLDNIDDAKAERESRVARAIAENKAARAKASTQEEAAAIDEKLNQEVKSANAAYLKAHATYLLNGGKPTAEKDPAQQIRALSLAAKTLEDEYQLPAYESKMAGSWHIPLLSPVKDPTKDEAIKLRSKYYDAINKLVRRWADDTVGDISGGPKDVNVNTNSPAKNIPSFNTEAELMQAVKSGSVKSGDRVIVGGRAATWK